MMQEELAGEPSEAFPVHGLREELHPSVTAQHPSRPGQSFYKNRLRYH